MSTAGCDISLSLPLNIFSYSRNNDNNNRNKLITIDCGCEAVSVCVYVCLSVCRCVRVCVAVRRGHLPWRHGDVITRTPRSRTTSSRTACGAPSAAERTSVPATQPTAQTMHHTSLSMNICSSWKGITQQNKKHGTTSNACNVQP